MELLATEKIQTKTSLVHGVLFNARNIQNQYVFAPTNPHLTSDQKSQYYKSGGNKLAITTRAYVRFKLLKAIESIQVCRAEGASIRALAKEFKVGTRTLQRYGFAITQGLYPVLIYYPPFRAN